MAGVKENINGELESTSKPFICPHDGHFGDPDDCTKFYKCAHGTPIAEYCPATLFWNQGEYRSDIKTLYYISKLWESNVKNVHQFFILQFYVKSAENEDLNFPALFYIF